MIMIQLSDAIINSLKTNGLEVSEFTMKDLIDKKVNLTRPAVNIDIAQAQAKKITLTTYKYVCTVSLVIVFQYLKDDVPGSHKRKEGTWKILEAVADYLTLQDFNLPLENKLIPMGFKNITTYDLAISGYSMYQMTFWTSYNVSLKDDTEFENDLKSIVASYYIEPDEVTVRAGDNITNLT